MAEKKKEKKEEGSDHTWSWSANQAKNCPVVNELS
jgi:hypothetical protein